MARGSARVNLDGGALDILHVATALHLGVRELLTFDDNQARLAKAAGLKIRP